MEFQVWDRFILAADTFITALTWQGSYFNARVADPDFAPPANSTGFVVGFYADDAGAPGALLVDHTFTPAATNETFVGQQPFGDFGLSIYNYAALLATSFAAAGGTPYWLGIHALSPFSSETEAQWGWNGGTGGDGVSTQFNILTGLTTSTPPDRAFALEGVAAPIPEPATLILLGGGLATMIARSRARRGSKRDSQL